MLRVRLVYVSIFRKFRERKRGKKEGLNTKKKENKEKLIEELLVRALGTKRTNEKTLIIRSRNMITMTTKPEETNVKLIHDREEIIKTNMMVKDKIVDIEAEAEVAVEAEEEEVTMLQETTEDKITTGIKVMTIAKRAGKQMKSHHSRSEKEDGSQDRLRNAYNKIDIRIEKIKRTT